MRLFVCNTAYQIIVACQLALTLPNDNDNAVLITDQVSDSMLVCNRISKLSLFRVVFHATIRARQWKEGLIYFTRPNDVINLFEEFLSYGRDRFL